MTIHFGKPSTLSILPHTTMLILILPCPMHSTRWVWLHNVCPNSTAINVCEVWKCPQIGHKSYKIHYIALALLIWPLSHIRATSHTRLRARDHYTPSTLIGEKGGAAPSSLHTTLEGPTEWVCECKMDVKCTWIDSYVAWSQTDHASWLLGLFSKTTSWR